jgi:glycerol-3-phosphate dehydrogenase
MGEVQLVKRYRIHEHRREEGLDGLVSVIGVKFTEARHVAETAVDLVFRKLGKPPPKSATAITPLHGGQIERLQPFLAQEMLERPRGLNAEVVRGLIYHYGAGYREVLSSLDDGSATSQSALDDACLLEAEVLYGIRVEMAHNLTDMVARRLPQGIAETPEEPYLRACAAIMAKELGWDDTRVQNEVQAVRAICDAGQLRTEAA